LFHYPFDVTESTTHILGVFVGVVQPSESCAIFQRYADVIISSDNPEDLFIDLSNLMRSLDVVT